MSDAPAWEFHGVISPANPENFRIRRSKAPSRSPSRQLEQPTLNQRVQGSSPCAPTNKINNLSANWCCLLPESLALDNVWATSFFIHCFL
jgi:hypothetical protein